MRNLRLFVGCLCCAFCLFSFAKQGFAADGGNKVIYGPDGLPVVSIDAGCIKGQKGSGDCDVSGTGLDNSDVDDSDVDNSDVDADDKMVYPKPRTSSQN
ncbi:MAG: hypothetical protein Q7T03_07650 [Deltaproteobacteria bacterium]|nr:hypothetical protein [Deltaproteobacteria bacterium]